MQRADHDQRSLRLRQQVAHALRPQAIARIENHVADLGQREDRRFIGDASHGRQIAFEPCSMHALERALRLAGIGHQQRERGSDGVERNGLERVGDLARRLQIPIRFAMRIRPPQHARLDAVDKLLEKCRRNDQRGPRTKLRERRQRTFRGPGGLQTSPGVDGNERLQNLCAGLCIGFEERQDRRRIGFKDQRFGPVIGFFDPGRRSAARRGKQMHGAKQAHVSTGDV